MWTPAAQAQLVRPTLPYATCLTDAEWGIAQALLPPPSSCGRRRRWPMRLLLDAMLYVLRTGWGLQELWDGPPLTLPAVSCRGNRRDGSLNDADRGIGDRPRQEQLQRGGAGRDRARRPQAASPAGRGREARGGDAHLHRGDGGLQLRAFLLERGITVLQGRRSLASRLMALLGEEQIQLSPRTRLVVEDMRAQWSELACFMREG